MLSSRVQVTVAAPVGPSAFPSGVPGDLAALSDVKLDLNITDNSNDTWLSKQITLASASITNFLERFVGILAYQDTIYLQRDVRPASLDRALSVLKLSQWPLVNIQCAASIAPPPAPTVSATVHSGALPAQKYSVRISYVTPTGETALSLPTLIAASAGTVISVTPPAADAGGVATGYNVYVGSAYLQETLQNGAPISLSATWTMPGSGTNAGAVPPAYVTAVSYNGVTATPLAEGVDFVVDQARGHLIALDQFSALAKDWNAAEVFVQYYAGFATIPFDIQDACIRTVKSRWFARGRDPMLRQENVSGVGEATYWFGSGPGNPLSNLPPDVIAILSNYRQAVIA